MVCMKSSAGMNSSENVTKSLLDSVGLPGGRIGTQALALRLVYADPLPKWLHLTEASDILINQAFVSQRDRL